MPRSIWVTPAPNESAYQQIVMVDKILFLYKEDQDISVIVLNAADQFGIFKLRVTESLKTLWARIEADE